MVIVINWVTFKEVCGLTVALVRSLAKVINSFVTIPAWKMGIKEWWLRRFLLKWTAFVSVISRNNEEFITMSLSWWLERKLAWNFDGRFWLYFTMRGLYCGTLGGLRSGWHQKGLILLVAYFYSNVEILLFQSILKSEELSNILNSLAIINLVFGTEINIVFRTKVFTSFENGETCLPSRAGWSQKGSPFLVTIFLLECIVFHHCCCRHRIRFPCWFRLDSLTRAIKAWSCSGVHCLVYLVFMTGCLS